jgi:hypothetical protein
MSRLRHELSKARAEAAASRALAEDACLQLHVSEARAEARMEALDARLADSRLRAWEAASTVVL